MEYTVVCGEGTVDLSQKVNEFIQAGWEPFGSIAVRNNILFQAMIRK